MPRNIVDDDHASLTRAAVDLGLDAEVALDAGDRIDDDVGHRSALLLLGGVVLGLGRACACARSG